MYPDLAMMLSMLNGSIGCVFLNQDENEKAYNYLNQAIAYDETILSNWVNLALLDLKVGRSDSCMMICERILSIDPTNENAFQLKGDLFFRWEKIDLAFMFYKRAIEVNPESHRANSSMGDIFNCSGKLKEAIDHYKKAISVRIDLADTFAKLCKAKLNCCDWEQQDECYNHLF
jgi:tetratricopeptide (TPR) repeat protein